jgi:hypothetical protein
LPSSQLEPLTNDGHPQHVSTFAPETSKTPRHPRPFTPSKLAFQTGRSSLPPMKNVSQKRICHVSPTFPLIQTQGWRLETPVSSSSEVEVGLFTLLSAYVRYVGGFYGTSRVPPVLVSDAPEAWLYRSDHRRIKGTALAHRQVNLGVCSYFAH